MIADIGVVDGDDEAAVLSSGQELQSAGRYARDPDILIGERTRVEAAPDQIGIREGCGPFDRHGVGAHHGVGRV